MPRKLIGAEAHSRPQMQRVYSMSSQKMLEKWSIHYISPENPQLSLQGSNSARIRSDQKRILLPFLGCCYIILTIQSRQSSKVQPCEYSLSCKPYPTDDTLSALYYICYYSGRCSDELNYLVPPTQTFTSRTLPPPPPTPTTPCSRW